MGWVDTAIQAFRDQVMDSEGRVSDATLTSWLLEIDKLIKAHTGSLVLYDDVDLKKDANFYELPKACVRVVEVYSSSDGTNFNQGALVPSYIKDFDYRAARWRLTRRSLPTHYSVQGAPGQEIDLAQLFLYPAPAASSGKVRVYYHGVYTEADSSSFLEQEIPEEDIVHAYVPGLVARFNALHNYKAFALAWQKHVDGLFALGTRMSARDTLPGVGDTFGRVGPNDDVVRP